MEGFASTTKIYPFMDQIKLWVVSAVINPPSSNNRAVVLKVVE